MQDQKRTRDGATASESLPPAAVGQQIAATAGRLPPTGGSLRGHRSELDSMIDEVLKQRDVATVLIDDDHRILAASPRCAALYSGRPLLGRKCYEAFHRRKTACKGGAWRCPLRHVHELGEPCRVVHVHHTGRGEAHQEISSHPSARRGLPTCLEIRPVTVASTQPCPCRLVGRSPALSHMLELLLRAAPRETPVLVIGEPGTCRESVARALHRLGGKPDDAFVAVHCPGLRQEGLVSALRIVMSDAAAAGRHHTLYLDDVGELGTGGQGELLRLLKTADRRGAAGPRPVCAARPDLRARVDQGLFLDDLYYRVSVFPVHVPSLGERREDLPLLAECLLRQISDDPQPVLDPRTLAVLERYAFPGNLRELRRILEHACLQATGRRILPEDLPPETRG